jgi:hypothetical protein
MQLINVLSLLPLIAVAAASPLAQNHPPSPRDVPSDANTPQCPITALERRTMHPWRRPTCVAMLVWVLAYFPPALYSVILLTATSHLATFALVSFWLSGTTLPQDRITTRPKPGSNLIQATRQSKAPLPLLSASRLIVLVPSMVCIRALGVLRTCRGHSHRAA